MMAITFSYDFVLRDKKRLKGVSLWTKTGTEKEQPRFRGSNIVCDLDSVDTILLSDGPDIKVFWDIEVFGPNGDPSLLMSQPRDLALILICNGENTLIMKTEPTLDDRIGIVIASEEGKVLFSGEGDLINIDEYAKGIQQFIFHFQEVYKWKKFNPWDGCAHGKGAARKTKTIPTSPETPPPKPPPDGGPEQPPSPQ